MLSKNQFESALRQDKEALFAPNPHINPGQNFNPLAGGKYESSAPSQARSKREELWEQKKQNRMQQQQPHFENSEKQPNFPIGRNEFIQPAKIKQAEPLQIQQVKMPIEQTPEIDLFNPPSQPELFHPQQQLFQQNEQYEGMRLHDQEALDYQYNPAPPNINSSFQKQAHFEEENEYIPSAIQNPNKMSRINISQNYQSAPQPPPPVEDPQTEKKKGWLLDLQNQVRFYHYIRNVDARKGRTSEKRKAGEDCSGTKRIKANGSL